MLRYLNLPVPLRTVYVVPPWAATEKTTKVPHRPTLYSVLFGVLDFICRVFRFAVCASRTVVNLVRAREDIILYGDLRRVRFRNDAPQVWLGVHLVHELLLVLLVHWFAGHFLHPTHTLYPHKRTTHILIQRLVDLTA